jgi:hypothetical protein
MVIELAISRNMATRTNPSSARPPYWPRLVDDAEGRRELARRYRVLLGHPVLAADATEAAVNPGSRHSFHGDQKWEFITEWIEENLQEEMVNA